MLELDELWRTVGWTLGSWGEAPLRKWWQTLPAYCYHCWLCTDQWEAYAKVLPRWQHRPCPKDAGQTSIVEAINCSLRRLRRARARVLRLQQVAGHTHGPN